MTREPPDDRFETLARSRGARRIAGVDEVGRGPLAGPVTAAAVILDPRHIPEGLADSKALGATARARLAARIIATAEVSIAHASVAEIDHLNILGATGLAMRRAISGLAPAPDHLLIDGNSLPAVTTSRASAASRVRVRDAS